MSHLSIILRNIMRLASLPSLSISVLTPGISILFVVSHIIECSTIHQDIQTDRRSWRKFTFFDRLCKAGNQMKCCRGGWTYIVLRPRGSGQNYLIYYTLRGRRSSLEWLQTWTRSGTLSLRWSIEYWKLKELASLCTPPTLGSILIGTPELESSCAPWRPFLPKS